MFYDLFQHLCNEKGVSASRACIDMGLSRSLAAKWKNTGGSPQGETLTRMADYFGVSTDFLLAGGKEERRAKLSDKDIKVALFDGDVEEITDEMFEDVKRYALFLKEKKRKNGD